MSRNFPMYLYKVQTHLHHFVRQFCFRTCVIWNLSCSKCIRYRFYPDSYSTTKQHTSLHISVQPSSHRSYYSNIFRTVPHRRSKSVPFLLYPNTSANTINPWYWCIPHTDDMEEEWHNEEKFLSTQLFKNKIKQTFFFGYLTNHFCILW